MSGDVMSDKKKHPYADAPMLPLTGPIDVSTLTRSELPLEIEIGPGRGAFILERAAETSKISIVGLEIRWKWGKIVDDRLKAGGYGQRARVYATDARFALPRFQPDSCVEAFYVHFPDPWWKKRQQKRLVVEPTFVRQMVRLLVPGGRLFVQTDVAARAQQYETLLSNVEELVPYGDTEGSPHITQVPWDAKSNRERRVLEAGLSPTRLLYRREKSKA